MQSNPLNFNPNEIIASAKQLHQEGKLNQAEILFRKILTHFPNHPECLTLLATISLQRNELDSAIKQFEFSLKILPKQPLALSNMGVALALLKRFNESITAYNMAIDLGANDADVYFNLGNTLIALDRITDAQKSYQKALSLNPSYVKAYNNLGLLFKQQNRLDKALESYQHAINLDPHYVDANWNKAIIKILKGEYIEGWQLFEYRWLRDIGSSSKFTVKKLSQPLWLGQCPLKDKILFIHAEQGLGDIIQFCRYIPIIEEMGAKVIIELPIPLIPLIRSLTPNFSIISIGETPQRFDFHIPIMSLPLALKTSLKTIPSNVPYLFPNNEKQDIWEKIIFKDQLNIGIVWSGGKGHLNDHQRSIPAILLKPILDLPIIFHCLQKEIRAEDSDVIDQYSNLHCYEKELMDFSDTAAIISKMDLVVSVDTSVAHLTGALGAKLWLLLPFAPDYRWLLEREDSPWYPSAKIFRQDKLGDWEKVIEKIKEQLILLIKK